MADKKYLDEDGLALVATKVNEKLKVVTTMPATPTNGQVVLYIGTTTATYTQGGIYLYNGTAWVLISTADVDLTPYKKIFTGTRAEWSALTTAEKKEYDEADLTDDTAGGELVVSDAVTAGDLNPVTSNAVYDVKVKKIIKNMTFTAGSASQIVPFSTIGIDSGSRLVAAHVETSEVGVEAWVAGVATNDGVIIRYAPDNGASYPIAFYYI